MLVGDPHDVTTRHSASAYPWQCQAGLPPAGVALGLDHLAGGVTFCYDPSELYARQIVSDANMMVLGRVGRGKSAFTKSYLARRLLAGAVAHVLDPKREYAAFAEACGLCVIPLVPGTGGARLNPLDAGPSGLTEPHRLRHERLVMLSALLGSGLGREPTAAERACLAQALDAATAARPSPLIADVVEVMLAPTARLAAAIGMTRQRFAEAASEAALALQRLLTGDLAGMFDGPTEVDVDWSKGAVWDLHEVFGTAALGPAMVCVGQWLANSLMRNKSHQVVLVLDEVWAILRLVAVTRWLQSVAKLSRTFGVQLVCVLHRLGDLTAQGDAGSEAAQQALSLLGDIATRVVFAQPESERERLTELLGLTGAEVALVGRLARGRALWKLGAKTAVVEHVITPFEAGFCDTDQAMRRGLTR